MSLMITYFCWYLTLLGTGAYFLLNAIGGRSHWPQTTAWVLLWNVQLASGLAMTSLPFIHLWMRTDWI